MVLTFTLSLGAAESGGEDVRTILIGALGCNLAWAIIDAVMYLMATRGERWLAISTVRSIRNAKSPAAGRTIVADHMPAAILPALTEADLDRIRVHLCNLPPEGFDTRFRTEDYLAALGVFLLVFLCLFPVAVPFLLFEEVPLALRVSNIIAIAMLFITGFGFGIQVGRPWRTGFLMVAIGIILVSVAMAFGG